MAGCRYNHGRSGRDCNVLFSRVLQGHFQLLKGFASMSKKERESGIELFRILCMLFVICCHFQMHAHLSNPSTLTGMIGCVGYMGGSAGNLGFICISAYYLDTFRFRFHKFANLFFKASLYSAAAILIGVAFFQMNYSVGQIVAYAFPLFFEKYGYLSAYMAIFWLSPALKVILERMPRRTHKCLCVVSTVFFTILPVSTLGNYPFSNLLSVFLYCIIVINYLKKYHPSIINNQGLMAVSSLLSWICLIGVEETFLYLRNNNILALNLTGHFTRVYSLPIIFAMGTMFFCFHNLKLKSNNLINAIAGTTLGIYILHEAPATCDLIWDAIFSPQDWGQSPFFAIKMIGAVIFVFMTCMLIELFIQFILRQYRKIIPQCSYWKRLCHKIDTFMESEQTSAPPA